MSINVPLPLFTRHINTLPLTPTLCNSAVPHRLPWSTTHCASVMVESQIRRSECSTNSSESNSGCWIDCQRDHQCLPVHLFHIIFHEFRHSFQRFPWNGQWTADRLLIGWHFGSRTLHEEIPFGQCCITLKIRQFFHRICGGLIVMSLWGRWSAWDGQGASSFSEFASRSI